MRANNNHINQSSFRGKGIIKCLGNSIEKMSMNGNRNYAGAARKISDQCGPTIFGR